MVRESIAATERAGGVKGMAEADGHLFDHIVAAEPDKKQVAILLLAIGIRMGAAPNSYDAVQSDTTTTYHLGGVL